MYIYIIIMVLIILIILLLHGKGQMLSAPFEQAFPGSTSRLGECTPGGIVNQERATERGPSGGETWGCVLCLWNEIIW